MAILVVCDSTDTFGIGTRLRYERFLVTFSSFIQGLYHIYTVKCNMNLLVSQRLFYVLIC